MTAGLRRYGSAAARDRGILAPLVALASVLLGVYATRPNDVQSAWALTGLLAFPLTAWLVGTALRSVPEPHREMDVAALGGAGAGDRVTLALAALLAAVVAALLLAWPLLIGAFDPAARARDVALGAAGHVICAALGGQLGRTLVPPVVDRRATAAAVVLAATLLSVALAPAVGTAAGPMAVSEALAGDDSAALLAAGGWCLALCIALEAARRRLVGWIG